MSRLATSLNNVPSHDRPDTELLDRITGMEFTAKRGLAPEVVEHEYGWAAIDLSIPLIWDANYLVIEDPSASAERVIAISDEILGSRGFKHRKVHVSHNESTQGKSLIEDLHSLDSRWEPSAEVYMPHLHELERRPGIEVRQVPGEEILEGREEIATEAAGVNHTSESMRQILRFEELAMESLEGVWFGAGDPPDGFCQLLLHPSGVGQVENVGTIDRSRGKGLASAAISAAIEFSRKRGDDLLYIVADAGDWPQHLYEKLGFSASGQLASATLKPPSEIT